MLPQLEALTNEMTDIGKKYGASCSQIGIAWAIAKGTTPIIGATKERHVVEAAEAAKIELTAEELAPVMQANKMVGEIDSEANLAALYYDLAGAHSPEVVRMLLTIATPSHLLYGSDYPYVAPQVLTQSLRRMENYLTTEPDLAPFREMILWKNAQLLFQEKFSPRNCLS